MINTIEQKSCLFTYSKFSLNLFSKIYSSNINVKLEKLYIIIHHMFKFEFIAVYATLIFLYLCCKMRKMEQVRFQQNAPIYFSYVTKLFLATVLSTFIIIAIKNFSACPRPLYYIKENLILRHDLYKELKEWDNSFPSGHVSLVSILLFTSWSLLNRFYKFLGLLILTITSISRVGLGLHFPHDVLGAIVLCAVIYYLANIIANLRFIQLIRDLIVSKIILPYIINFGKKEKNYLK